MTESERKRLGNFRDPFGLLARMLKSGNRAAYAALLREGLRIASKPADRLLSISQSRTTDPTQTDHPLVFIVGAPRSGTTLVYQVLSAFLDVTFPTNLTEMFPKSPLRAAQLQKSVWPARRPDFRNYYGQTAHFSGPNDAFHIWNRWLGEDRYQPQRELADAVVSEMQQFFAAWTSAFNKPFLNKNNRNAIAVDVLARHLPNSRFIVIRRNPLYVVQSLIVARQQIQGTKSIGWGLQSSSSVTTSDHLGYVDDVCRQVSDIDMEIDRQLADVDPSRVLQVTYESFCEQPQHWVTRVTESFRGVKLNPGRSLDDLPSFRVSQKMTVSAAEHQRMLQALNGLLSNSQAVAQH